MFTGVGTAIITPFDKETNVDYNSLKTFVNFRNYWRSTCY